MRRQRRNGHRDRDRDKDKDTHRDMCFRNSSLACSFGRLLSNLWSKPLSHHISIVSPSPQRWRCCRGAYSSVLHSVFRFHVQGEHGQAKPRYQWPSIQTSDSIMSTPSRSISKRTVRNSELWWRPVCTFGFCRWWPVSLWRHQDDPTRKKLAEINCEPTLLRMAISSARTLMQGARTAHDREWTLDEVSSNARHHVLPLSLQTLTLSCCGTWFGSIDGEP